MYLNLCIKCLNKIITKGEKEKRKQELEAYRNELVKCDYCDIEFYRYECKELPKENLCFCKECFGRLANLRGYIIYANRYTQGASKVATYKGRMDYLKYIDSVKASHSVDLERDREDLCIEVDGMKYAPWKVIIPFSFDMYASYRLLISTQYENVYIESKDIIAVTYLDMPMESSYQYKVLKVFIITKNEYLPIISTLYVSKESYWRGIFSQKARVGVDMIKYLFEDYLMGVNLRYPILPYRNFIKTIKTDKNYDLPMDLKTLIVRLEKAKSYEMDVYNETDQAIKEVNNFINRNGWVVLDNSKKK